MIAMFIAAIMFAIGYRALNQALSDRESLNVSQARVTEIQRGMRVVAQDFAQMRGARRARHRRAPVNCMPAVSADARDNTLITFSRTGWSNPAGIQRPAEQRVRYRFVDGSLVREHWLSVDPALNAEPRQRVLLTRVKSVEIRFLDPVSRNWRNEWPVAARHRTGDSGQRRSAAAARARSPSSSRWCSRTGAACSACSRFPHEARASTRRRAAGGDRDLCDRDHGRGRHHLQQGHGGAPRRRDLHAGAGAAGRHGGRSARGHRARGRWQQAQDPDSTQDWAQPLGPVEIEGTGVWIQAQLEDLSGRFNLNSVVKWDPPDQHLRARPAPGRGLPAILLRDLDIDLRYADLLVDWIDPDIAAGAAGW